MRRVARHLSAAHGAYEGRARSAATATWPYILGIDRERLTYRFHGRDYRLTDVHGKVVRQILA